LRFACQRVTHPGNRDEYPLPRLVLLDLSMPGLDGYDVLTWIRQQDGIRGLPVIV
jgi:CheY-like chemotaxis protein